MASTSAAALVNGLGSTFLTGGKKSQALLSARVGGAAPSKRVLVVVAAAATKKSWLPGVRGGGNLVDPEWLDGSYVPLSIMTSIVNIIVIIMYSRMNDCMNISQVTW